MPHSTVPPLPPGAARGFTLLEMLVVLAITGLIAGLLYPQIETANVAVRQRLAREQIAASAERARALALRSGAPAVLRAADGGTTLVIAGQTASTQRLALDPAGRIRLALMPDRITFYPDGSATGGQILLGAGRPGRSFSGETFTIDRASAQLRVAARGGDGA